MFINFKLFVCIIYGNRNSHEVYSIAADPCKKLRLLYAVHRYVLIDSPCTSVNISQFLNVLPKCFCSIEF